MTRWWNQYTSIPWPDPIAVFVSSNVHGQDERGRVMRRTIMRYVCLCLTMVLINVSPRVKKRFPDLTHLVDAGLLNDNEKAIIESMNKGFPRHSKHWLPIVWAASIITRARKEGRIRDDFAVKTIIDELNKFRGQCGLLISYDTISVPLVYTQVVTLAVYSFFLCSVMGQQWTEDKQAFQKIDIYFPVFTTLQFFFYMGWLKVAESLINPFGEDDDDFEVCFINFFNKLRWIFFKKSINTTRSTGWWIVIYRCLISLLMKCITTIRNSSRINIGMKCSPTNYPIPWHPNVSAKSIPNRQRQKSRCRIRPPCQQHCRACASTNWLVAGGQPSVCPYMSKLKIQIKPKHRHQCKQLIINFPKCHMKRRLESKFLCALNGNMRCSTTARTMPITAITTLTFTSNSTIITTTTITTI